MGARVSQAMIDAMAMLRAGKGKVSAYAAAKAFGLSRSSISESKLYREWKKEQENAKLHSAK